MPVYQWQISTDGVTFSNIDGATSSTFTLSPTTLADKGKRYRVVVTNRAGSVTSTAATLDVYPAIASYAFAALGSRMTTARAMHTATTLQDGKVLITGGFSANTSPGAALNTAELYDPATKTFTALTARMRSARTSHAAALLPDGRVLITGGQADNNNGDGVATAELYDPSTRTFSSVVALMKSPRGGHSSTLLANGKVLLAGGYYGPRPLTSDAELFDPATQTFTALAAKMVTVTEGHRATLLPSGRVLVSGGSDNNLFRSVQEQFDPVTQAFSALGARMTTVRGAHEATMLPGRWVVLTGGASSFSPSGVTAHRSAEVFDTVTQVFSSIAAMMTTARAGHAAARLADGSVLLTGGATTTVPGGGIAVLDTAELFRVGASIDKPSVSISADPSSLVLGNSATLRWTATLADSCVASGAWSGAKGLSGTQAVTPAATGLQTYTLACAGPGGTTTASATVQVQAPAAIPTVSLSANPTTVAAGSTFTLQWSSANATSCTASGSWAGAKSTAGSETVQAGTTAGSRTFTLTCTGPGGSASSTTTVNVTDIACAQIGGTWTETGRMTGTCEPQDDFDSGTQTGTGTIVQNGCNISISIAGVTRAGTVRGFSFTLTGPVGISTPGLTLTANTITITGSISADARRITATGVGQVGGVFDDGFAQMCTVNTTSTMTR